MGPSEMGMPEETILRPAVGRRIGEYELIAKVGRGGMGQVFEARHIHLDRNVAIKFMHSRASDEAAQRFQREMRAVGRLPLHQNLVLATDAGVASGVLYLVMELVHGVVLSSFRSRKEGVPTADACEMIRQAAIGLQYIANHGMVHRDLKPGNLLLSNDGIVKVLDLGLAKCCVATDEESDFTQAGQSLGTPDYMAPEQWEDSHSVDIRADIYSLGCTLYFLLAGRAPFDDGGHNTVPRKMYAHLHDEPQPIVELRDDVPDALIGVLEKLLQKDPDSRFQTPEEVAEALQPHCRDHKVSALAKNAVELKSTAVHRRENSLCDTASFQSDSTPIGESAFVEESARSKFTRWLVAAMASCLVIALIGFLAKDWATRQPKAGGGGNQGFGIQASKSPTAESVVAENSQQDESLTATNILDMKVSHFRMDESGTLESLGLIEESPRVDIRVEDDVRVKVSFDAPSYAYLVALNPDGSVQLCSPADDEQAPQRVKELTFPSDSSSFFGLTDGEGPQAFVVLASSRPLAPFSEQRAQLKQLPWSPFELSGIWKFDGDEIAPIGRFRFTRGTVRRRVPPTLDQTLSSLRQEFGVEDVHAVAFPVAGE